MNLFPTQLLYALPLLLISLHSLADSQHPTNRSPLIYTVTVDDRRVGTSRYRTTHSEDGSYIIMMQSSINTEGWLDSIKQDTSHIERYSADGKLLEINRKIFDGSKVDWLQVQRQDNELWGGYTEVKNLSQKEEDELTGLSMSIASHALPMVGNLITASQLLFPGRDRPSEGTRFSDQEFDTSFENLPFIWQQQGNRLPSTLRILDSDSLAITVFTVTAMGERYRLSDDDDNNLTLSFITTNNQPAFNTISGTDSDGTFSLTLENPTGTGAP